MPTEETIAKGNSSRLDPSYWIGLASFVLLFPTFFLYQRAVHEGMPSFLAGYTGIVSASLLPFLLVAVALRYRSERRIAAIDVLFFAFLSFAAIWASLIELPAQQREVGGSVIGGLVILLTFFLIGRTFTPSKRWSPLVIGASFLSTSAIFFMNSRDGVFLLGAGESSATYQQFALIYLFISGIALALVQSASSQWVVFGVALTALILNGARTEVGALIVIFGVYTVLGPKRARHLGFLILAVGIAAPIASLLQEYEGNRIANLIFLQAEGSRTERAIANELATWTIGQSPLTGEFASYPPGMYAHNILSVWVDFGIIGMMLYLAMILIPAAYALRRKFDFTLNRQLRIAVSFCVAATLALIFFKSYLYPFFALAIGLFSQLTTRQGVRVRG